MADKKLTAVTEQTDMDYVIIEKNNDIYKISKQDLASIVGGLLPVATESSKGLMPPSLFVVETYALNSYSDSIDVKVNGFLAIQDFSTWNGYVLYFYTKGKLTKLTDSSVNLNISITEKDNYVNIKSTRTDGYTYIKIIASKWTNYNGV